MSDRNQHDRTDIDGDGQGRDAPCQAVSIPQAWRSEPPGVRALSDRDVHIWRGRLDAPAWRVEQLAQTLSDDERSRARRFRLERDRTRFIVARGVLRSILGGYLGIEAGQVQFRYGAYGKPYLCKALNQGRLRFNVAHSHQLVLYALARSREIGIDLEFARPLPGLQQTAAGFMSAAELAALSTLPVGQQQQAFYRCWTRKEAYIKATGMGMQQPLEQVSVSLAVGEPARLLSVEGYPGETDRWSLRSFAPARGYVAALAVEGHDWCPTFWGV